ncbi:redox-sensing transcriptional repressor Rex [Natronoglycomyces albus]|uniref:Redox-sensing transcriptional repressor Rex n=1 Tax=Natronoglycomyces albus TaxID=2811108 RepID=A0A895XVB9_9ACTN|nr:redox-sensing transcriptional repressor Rex [Natronoglycomyces albus]QSB05588.1 redox-sensing transcriptional repressor Rex [Natronoglycomyces albus]
MTTTGDRTSPPAATHSIPTATVQRLPEYLRALHALGDTDGDTISSEALAAVTGVSSAMLRKDLSYLGAAGVRGVGYEVSLLTNRISTTLGLTRYYRVALIGMGHLGQALARYPGFASRGFHIAAIFDASPDLIGSRHGNHIVRDISELSGAVGEEDINIGVIATPETAAQQVADLLIDAGITSILNFAPCVLTVPQSVVVRKVDLAVELQLLSFHEHHKALQRSERDQQL